MTWHTAGDFALWTGAILILLLVVLFCAVAVISLYEDAVNRRARERGYTDRFLAEERALRKFQNKELRERMNKLEIAVRELNPGGNI